MNASKKQLYIHIGLTKTGTTSIQVAIHKNRNQLITAGIAPATSGTVPPHAIHHNIAWYFLDKHLYNKEQGSPQDLVEEIQQSQHSRFLISSEYFFTFRQPHIEQLAQILDPISQVYIVLYLRKPQDWLSAEWQQAVKHGFSTDDIDTFCRKQLRQETYENGYEGLVKSWERYFKRDSLIIRSYDDALTYSKGLMGDFGQVIQLPDTVVDRMNKLAWQNTSLPYPYIDLIRQVTIHIQSTSNILDRDKAHHRTEFYSLFVKFVNQYRIRTQYSKIEMEANTHQKIEDHFYVSSQAIAQEFFGR